MAELPKLQLLTPFPIDFNNILIYKPTLREMFQEIGYQNFTRATNLLTITNIDIENYYKENNLPVTELEPFLWLLNNCLQDNYFYLQISFAFLIYTKASLYVEKDCFVLKALDTQIEIGTLNRQNFLEFQNIIRQINCIYSKEDEDDIITDNLRMKQKFLEKRKKLKAAKAKQAEKNKEKNLSLVDIISSLCVMNTGYNLINIWDLTIYQVYEQFTKSRSKDSFEKDFASILAGADSKKIKLQNWMKTTI